MMQGCCGGKKEKRLHINDMKPVRQNAGKYQNNLLPG
jgi:hypothetical protein